MDPETVPEAYAYPYLYELVELADTCAYPAIHLPSITGVLESGCISGLLLLPWGFSL